MPRNKKRATRKHRRVRVRGPLGSIPKIRAKPKRAPRFGTSVRDQIRRHQHGFG